MEERLSDEKVHEIIAIFEKAGAPGPGAVAGEIGGDEEAAEETQAEEASGAMYEDDDGAGFEEGMEDEMELEEPTSKYSNDNTDDC